MSRYITRALNAVKNKIGNHDIIGLRWIIDGFNFRDKSRIKEIGPDRVAAEWVVRNGGIVEFDKLKIRFNDFNMLIRATAELDPRIPNEQLHLIEIDATDSSISGFGCMHFEGLEHIIAAHFIRCKQLQDFGLQYIGDNVGDRLKMLTLESCPRITEYGLTHLQKFTALESLVLKDLKHVYKLDEAVQELKQSLPYCKIDFFQ